MVSLNPQHISVVTIKTDFGSFQEVQMLTPIDASIRFLPDLIFGTILEIFTGLLMNRLPLVPLLTIGAAISAISPFIMALADPVWSFWWAEFWAMLLLPAGMDSKCIAGPASE